MKPVLSFSFCLHFVLVLGFSLPLSGCVMPGDAGYMATETTAKELLIEQLANAVVAEANGGDVLNVAFVVTETVYNSELMAPYDVIQHSIFRDDQAYMLPFIVSPDGQPVTTFEGIVVTPHVSFAEAPPVDVLVIPSTGNSLDADLQNEAYINWIRETAEQAQYVITVCDGAFPLAQTGLLDGRMATTFPGDRDQFRDQFPEIDVRYDVNMVVDGKYITSVGGALSYEPAFYLVEKVYSREHALKTAGGLVWDWNLETLPHLIVEAP